MPKGNSMPASSTGLMRFYDVDSSNALLDPRIVVGVVVLFVVFELALRIVH